MSKLTPEQVTELEGAFKLMDTNSDGFITRDELTTLLKSVDSNVSDDVVTEMINEADTNNDGKINFQEFLAAAAAGQ